MTIMPYAWQSPHPQLSHAARAEARLHLWPHQSLTKHGFVWVIALTSGLLALPLISVIGSAILWGLLPFIAIVVAGLWLALRKSWADRTIVEDLSLTPDRAVLVRHDRSGERRWTGNPYWVSVRLHPTGGPVPNYLTLRGNDREVEIGAFLSEEERLALYRELTNALHALRSSSHEP